MSVPVPLEFAYYALEIIVGLGVIGGGVIITLVSYRNSKTKAAANGCAEAIQALEATQTAQSTFVGTLKAQNDLQASQIAQGIVERDSLTNEILKLKTTVDNIKDIPLEKIEQHMKTTNDILERLASGALRGERGDQGEQGEQGDQGVRGMQGIRGPQRT